MNNLDMVVSMPTISHFHVFSDETVQATKGEVSESLSFHPEIFLSSIQMTTDNLLVQYLKKESSSEIQAKIFDVYRYLLKQFRLQYGHTWIKHEEPMKHFLGNLTQRITYYSRDNDDEGAVKILQILRFLDGLSRNKEVKHIFKLSRERYIQKNYQIDSWFLECEKHLGL